MVARRQLLKMMTALGGSALAPVQMAARGAEKEKESTSVMVGAGAPDKDKVGLVTSSVAEWATKLRYEDIPPEVVQYAKLLLLDGIGCTIFGSTKEAATLLVGYADALGESKPEATIWGRRKKVPVRIAGMINGAAAHSTNVGDTHRATIVHTNYLMPQAAIAIAEREKKNGRDVITAIVAGNEVCTRAALATHLGLEGGYFNPEGRGWHATGSMGAIGTAVTTGKLLGLETGKMVQALVLAGTQPAGIYRPAGPYMGKHWFAGKAVANGIESAYLARQGFVAGYRLYEDGLCFGSGIFSPVYELEAAARGLGETWETRAVDMAIYPAKKTYYTNVDALLQILGAERVKFADIAKVRVISAFATSYGFAKFRKPGNPTEAFNSLQYVIAAAAHDGEYGFAQLAANKIEDPEILDFAEHNVEVAGDAELERAFHAGKWPGAVEVLTKTGKRFYQRFDYHIGQVENPISVAQLEQKFRRMTTMLGKGRSSRIIEMVNDIEHTGDMSRLSQQFSA